MHNNKAELENGIRSNVLSEQDPPELASNIRTYATPKAIDELSVYKLLPEEKHLFAKHYKNGDRILDLACGAGRTTLILHEMGLCVKGIDASENLIKTAQKRFPYLDLMVGRFERLGEPDCAYAHILISGNSLDLAYPEALRELALRECFRVLRPGGTFIFSSHNLKALLPWSPRYWRRAPLWKLRNALKAFQAAARISEGELHGIFCSPEFVVKQCERVGFKFLETVGPKMTSSIRMNALFSASIYYAFKKPAPEADSAR